MSSAVTSRSASAQADNADDLISRGVELRRQDRNAEALGLFNRALALQPTPRARAQVALAEMALGQWVQAEKDLKTALESKSDAWISAWQRPLEEALETSRQHIGTVEISGEPVGATVEIDGTVAGPIPGRYRAPIGQVIITVSSTGYLPTSRSVGVRADRTSAETIQLKRLEITGERPAPTTVSGSSGIPQTTSPDSPGWQRPAAWTLVGLGGVAIAAAVAETAIAVKRSHDFNANVACMDDGAGHILGGAVCQRIDADQTSATRKAVAGYISAGVFALSAAVLFASAPGHHQSRGVSLDLGNRAASVIWTAEFPE
jgi:tetratricopeptide (TPR) repeat protein